MAAGAVIDRTVHVAFAADFALSGAVGPVPGQNLGAKLHEPRVAGADALLRRHGGLRAGRPARAGAAAAADRRAVPGFARHGARHRLFRRVGLAAWIFIGLPFVAKAAFNDLGFPLLSTLFDRGRTTLGTVPFVTLGAHLGCVEGSVLGAAVFGTAAVATAYRVVGWLGRVEARPHGMIADGRRSFMKRRSPAAFINS